MQTKYITLFYPVENTGALLGLVYMTQKQLVTQYCPQNGEPVQHLLHTVKHHMTKPVEYQDHNVLKVCAKPAVT